VDEGLRSPLLDHDPGEPPVFRPGNLLEAARRRKRLPRMKALRDEGTSYHYLPAGRFSIASPSLMAVVARRMAEAEIPVHRGTSWTTDAPFRETESLIASRRKEGIVSVEMEAAALLAMGIAIGKPVICLAHVTNAMATRGEDFEKGGGAGLEESLTVCTLALSAALEHAGTKINRREGGRHE